MLRPCLGPRSSRVDRLKRGWHFQFTLAVLASIGSARYSVRSVLGIRVIEYLLGWGGLGTR
eukprot:5774395-Alexandrium_andersonii.AAC.1